MSTMNKRQKKNVSEDRLIITRRVTRLMSLKNGNYNLLAIPIDVLIMIFAKLSLKSIAICRCVSKLWASILRRSDFSELFLSMSCSTTPKLLFACKKNSELLFFSSLQPQNLDEDSSSVLASYQIKFSFSGNYRNFNLVHGLVCFDDFKFLKNIVKKVVKICNPSTGQVLILPKVKTSNEYLWSLLGYDQIGKQFKVLSMIQPKRGYDLVCQEHQVLTLGSGNMSWKMIDCCIPHNPPWKNICINGVLYYISFDTLTKTCIVCFDVRFEKFNFIKTTGLITREKVVQLINYNGKLGLLLYEGDVTYVFFDGRSISFKLWVLEDLKKQEWSEHTFLFPTMPENIVEHVRFVGMTQTNEIVLSSINKNYPSCLLYLNLEKNTIVRVTIQGMEAAKSYSCYTFLDHVENVELFGSV